ncbi:nucleoside phosphorylase [Clostridium minihomine]|uniref:nucleoside phosphorylase n=1 Tax=Clostridium minihomine TaxID=2045012 RepID=UPI000C793614|nr:nucleoside phosphorylase [Clostridium minihomine]
MKTLYLKADESIAPYVIFSGDPWRVEVLAKYLDNAQHVAFSREFNTYTGEYKGMKITVTSTGIGAPSAAIAVEEMYACGMKVAVRMGTVMSLKDELLGQFIIPSAAMREEGTSKTYVPDSYPAVADIGLINCMNQTVAEHGVGYHNGINCTMDGFYSQMKESRLSKERGVPIPDTYARLKKLGIAGIDMESSCILTLASLMGIRACVVTLVTVLENLKDELRGQERTDAEDLLCRVVLEGLYKLHQENQEGA